MVTEYLLLWIWQILFGNFIGKVIYISVLPQSYYTYMEIYGNIASVWVYRWMCVDVLLCIHHGSEFIIWPTYKEKSLMVLYLLPPHLSKGLFENEKL